MWLLDLTDAQLRSGLGLTLDDITVLRAATLRSPSIRENTISNERRLRIMPATIDPSGSSVSKALSRSLANTSRFL